MDTPDGVRAPLLGSRRRAALRAAAVTANSLMLLYVYWEYMQREMPRFCRMGVFYEEDCMEHGGCTMQGNSSADMRLMDHVWNGDMDTALERLGLFTFSLSMLSNLNLFGIVGTPVAAVYIMLERDRVAWLKMLITKHVPDKAQASLAVRQLESYFRMLAVCFVCVILLVPAHIDRPLAHYLTASCAFSTGAGSICLYLCLPLDFKALAEAAGGSDGDEFRVWAWRVRNLVRPALQTSIFVHVLALVAALMKAERLHDDWVALTFGLLEVTALMSYQLFVGVFIIDDLLVGKGLESKTPEQSGAEDKLSRNKVQEQPWQSDLHSLTSCLLGG